MQPSVPEMPTIFLFQQFCTGMVIMSSDNFVYAVTVLL
jgi:hypothetical protein